MTSWRSVWLCGVPLVLGGCLEQVWQDLEPFLDTGSSSGLSSSSSSTGDGTTDVAITGGIQTVTSASSSGPDPGNPPDTGSSSGTPDGEPLIIETFEFDPPELTEPGPSALQLKVSDNITTAILYHGSEIVTQGPPDALTYTFEATSEELNDDHTFKLVALDGKGGSVERETTLAVKLPAHGTVRCPFQDKLGSQHSGVAAVVFAGEHVAALGVRDEGSGPRLALWLINAKTCGVIWLRTIDNWTLLSEGKDLPSTGAALVRDENNNFVIAGNLLEGSKTRPYLALLSPGGSLLWERPGDLGDQATGVARVRWPYETIVMVGTRLTSANPPRYDGLVQGYKTNGSRWVDVLRAPFTADEFNKDEANGRTEKALAVVFNTDSDELLLVGEREFQPDINNPDIFQRTFTARYYPDGGRISSWTSSGDYLPHDSAGALRRCGNDFIAGGWTSDSVPGSKPFPLARRLDGEGKSLGRRSEPLADTQTHGIDCDREGKVVSASTRTVGGQTDGKLHAFLIPDQPLVWQAQYDGLGHGNDGATSLACDAWGYCAWGGYERVDGKTRALVQLHYP